MTWLGVRSATECRFDPDGLAATGAPPAPQVHADSLMPRGSLMVETRLSPQARPQTLLSFDRTFPWVCGLSLHALPGGGFTLIETQGDGVRHVTLPHQPESRMDIIRLTYSWDAPAQWGRLALERTETDRVHMKELAPPHPMPLADLGTLLTDRRQHEMDPDVEVVALSDGVEPLGPMPGLTGNTPVATPGGYTAIARLRRGDLVRTERGKTVPVLGVVSRQVPACGSFRPVRLRAPFFGLRRDIAVAPHQRLVLRGTDVEYTFGSEAVLVPARHLINGVSAFHVDGPALVTYHQVLLPGHEVLVTAGAQVESLHIGRLRRRPADLAASLLAMADRAGLPEHPGPVWPVLRPFEAVILAMARAA